MSEEVTLKEHITEKIGDLRNLFEEKLDNIINQTTKTNGRVNGLETWKNSVCEPLNQILEERKDTRKEARRLAVNILSWAIIGLISAFLGTFITTNIYAKGVSQNEIKKAISEMVDEKGNLVIEK